MNNAFKLINKFKHAFVGIYVVIKEESSLLLEVIIGIIAIILGIIFKISITDWVILCIGITLIIALELINTAIENLLDLIVFKYNIKVKKIKDIFAAATLILSLGMLAAGFLIFIPAIIDYFK